MRLGGGSGVRGVISNVWPGTTGSFASRLAQLVRARRGPVLWLTLCGTLLVIAIFVGTITSSASARSGTASVSCRTP